MSQANETLAGLRVLVVEDEPLIVMMLEEMLEDFGCIAVGPCSTVEAALTACEAGGFDAALVDMNLQGYSADSILAMLGEAGVPYAISSGADGAGPDGALQLRKPFGTAHLEATLRELQQRLALP